MKGDQIVQENARERAEVEHAPAGGRCAVRASGGSGGGGRSATRTGSAGDVAVGHHNDERLGFALGDQVVHDEAGVSLVAPAGFIFAAAVLQVEHGIAPGRILFIVRRRVDEAAEHGVGVLGRIEGLAQLAMRHVFESVEVMILGGDFDAAAPATGAVEIQAARIRNLGAVDDDLVVMKPFVLRSRFADPGAVVALGQGILHGADVERDALGLGRDDACAYAAFGVDLGVLLAALVQGGRLEVLHDRFVGLGVAERAHEQGAQREQCELCFHGVVQRGVGGCRANPGVGPGRGPPGASDERRTDGRHLARTSRRAWAGQG